MEVLGDPLPLVDDGEPLELLVQPGVLHRDPGVQREGLDERQVLLAELGGTDLVGQVEPAERDALARLIGTPRKLVIGGWLGGNP